MLGLVARMVVLRSEVTFSINNNYILLSFSTQDYGPTRSFWVQKCYSYETASMKKLPTVRESQQAPEKNLRITAGRKSSA